MSDIQIQCPQCKTRYLVSPIQLSLSQGHVCCTACLFEFNAYQTLQVKEMDVPHPSLSVLDHEESLPDPTQDIPHNAALEIFDRKIEASNIDLRTYLNNSQYFYLDRTPLPEFLPESSLTAIQASSKPILQGSNRWISLILIILNTALLLLIISQILIYNDPNNGLTNRFPWFKQAYHSICSLAHCRTEHINNLESTVIQAQKDANNQLTLNGKITNTGQTIQNFPVLNITVNSSDIDQQNLIFMPEQYIPSQLIHQVYIQPNQEFSFHLTLPIETPDLQSVQLSLKPAK